MIVDGLKAASKDPATAKVVYVGGDPTDGNAKQFHDGADKVMGAAGIKPAFETPGSWMPAKVQTYFEQAYTATQGQYRRGLGRERLQRRARDLGAGQERQEGPRQRPGREPARAAEHPARQADGDGLQAVPARGAGRGGPVDEAAQRREADVPDKTAADGTPFIPQTPTVVTAENMQIVFDDGNAKIAEVCTAEVKAACDEAGLK